MAVIYELKAWLDHGNAPENAEDAADLEQAMLGLGQGRYTSQIKQGGEFLVVSGPGREVFMFKRESRDRQVAELRSIYQSEPGASLQGDAAYERGMSKDE